MTPAPSNWLQPFLEHLSAQDTPAAMAAMERAYAATQGVDDAWPQALEACVQAGWLAGVERLVGWGVPCARLPRATRTLRQHALEQAARWTDTPHPTRLATYRLPGGQSCRPLSGEDAHLLPRALCTAPAPTLSPAEWATAWRHDRPLARCLLDADHVQPWGGAAACRQIAQLLASLLRARPVAADDLDYLLDHLPAGMPSHATPVLQAALAFLANPSGLPQPVSQALDLLQRIGRPVSTVVRHAARHARRTDVGEDLFVLAVRHDDPLAFARLLDAGLLPWTSFSAARPRDTRLPPQADVLVCIAAHLATTLRRPAADTWWGLLQRLAATPTGRQRLCQVHATPPACLGLPADRHRWQALVAAVRLDRCLDPPATPVAERPRL